MLTIFTFQVLPVKELGRLLSKSQLTEEIHEEGGDEEIILHFKKLEPFHEFSNSYAIKEAVLENEVATAIHKATQLEHQHFPDIFAPPPNA